MTGVGVQVPSELAKGVGGVTVINANAAVTLLEQRPEKKFQALSGIRTYDLCDAGVVLFQLYQSHMRAVVCGLAPYMCQV